MWPKRTLTLASIQIAFADHSGNLTFPIITFRTSNMWQDPKGARTMRAVLREAGRQALVRAVTHWSPHTAPARHFVQSSQKMRKKQRFLSFLHDVLQKVWENSVFSRFPRHFVDRPACSSSQCVDSYVLPCLPKPACQPAASRKTALSVRAPVNLLHLLQVLCHPSARLAMWS